MRTICEFGSTIVYLFTGLRTEIKMVDANWKGSGLHTVIKIITTCML
jgi:hypothetical protein